MGVVRGQCPRTSGGSEGQCSGVVGDIAGVLRFVCPDCRTTVIAVILVLVLPDWTKREVFQINLVAFSDDDGQR